MQRREGVLIEQQLPYASVRPAETDAGHLRTISICHYVWGGLVLCFSCIFIIHIVMGLAIVSGKLPMNTAVGATPATGGPPPTFFGWFFVAMGSCFVLLGWSVGILTIMSGVAIARRRWRTFSLVMAGINCASVPLGTLLGVFTFIVLLRSSVAGSYESQVR